jgi:predicted transcriptional regulator
MTSKKSSSRGSTLGFRIDPETKRQLQAAASAERKSTSDLLLELVHDRLDGIETVSARYEHLKGEVSELRRGLADSIEAVLVALGTGRKLTPDQAKTWVDKRLRKKL